MYYRRSKKPMIIAVSVFIAVLVITSILSLLLSKVQTGKDEQTEHTEQIETETKAAIKHKMILYHSNLVSVNVADSMILSEDTDKTIYEVTEDEDIIMNVLPLSTSFCTGVDVLDGETNPIQASFKTDETGTAIIGFTIPDVDVFVSLSFKEQETEPESSALRYELELDGVTDDIKKEYGETFNSITLLNSLGDSFSIGSDGAYKNVSKVTFIAAKSYSGDKQKGHIYKYLMFNEDDEWLILADYDMESGIYSFRDLKREKEAKESEEQAESERLARESEEADREAAEKAAQEAAREQAATTPEISSGGGQTTTTTPGLRFSLNGVSTVVIKYTGGSEDDFFQQIFGYVENKGITGDITGNFDSYEIDTENRIVTFSISLSNGSAIQGVYQKNNGKYTLSGL